MIHNRLTAFSDTHSFSRHLLKLHCIDRHKGIRRIFLTVKPRRKFRVFKSNKDCHSPEGQGPRGLDAKLK
jgi:hypothetical protein